MRFLQRIHVTVEFANILAFFLIGDGLTLCQRMHQDALSSSVQDIYVPQCNLDGSFEEVQCHGPSNGCWCVDQQGRELNGTRRKGPLKCTELGVLNLSWRFLLRCVLLLLFFYFELQLEAAAINYK